MNRLDTLTSREQDILVGVAAGQSNTQIAHELCLSEKTICNSLTMVFQKLGVQSRTEAAVLVLINPDDGRPLVSRARARALDRLGALTAATEELSWFEQSLPVLRYLTPLEHELRGGKGRIADINFKSGSSSIALARMYPSANIDSFGFDNRAIWATWSKAVDAGIADRIKVRAYESNALGDSGGYHAVFISEGIYETPRPVELLTSARRALVPGGSVMVLEAPTGDGAGAPQEAAPPGGQEPGRGRSRTRSAESGTDGAVMVPNMLRMYALVAGLPRIDVTPTGVSVPGHFYRMRTYSN